MMALGQGDVSRTRAGGRPGSLWGAPTPGWTFQEGYLATSWQINGGSLRRWRIPAATRAGGAGPADVPCPAPRGRSFPGLSRLLKDTLRIAVVAVVFAVVSAWGLIIPVCQSEKLRISELGAAGPPFPCLVGENKERCCGNPQVLGYRTASGWGRAAPRPEEGLVAGTAFPEVTAVTPLCSGF